MSIYSILPRQVKKKGKLLFARMVVLPMSLFQVMEGLRPEISPLYQIITEVVGVEILKSYP
jgi:hypothetical protein